MAEIIIFDRQQIHAISYAVQTLIPVLADSEHTILPDGTLTFDHHMVPDALDGLRALVEKSIPGALRERIASRSGLGWHVFFGHVVAWWFPQRARWGFLRAFADRASLFGVKLRLHWNTGCQVEPLVASPKKEALVWGGGLGLVAAVLGMRLFDFNGLTSALFVATGVVSARVFNRISVHYVCGDPLCRAPRQPQKECTACGALWP